VLLLQWLAPWSLFVVLCFKKGFRRQISGRPLLYFAVVFLLCNLPLYWFTPDHKVRYLYMFFPFFCWLLADAFNGSSGKLKQGLLRVFGAVMVVATLAMAALPFVPALADVPHIGPAAGVLASGGILWILAYYRWPAQRMLVFVVFMAWLRVAFNISYLPAAAAQSHTMIYRNEIRRVLDITGPAPVHWYGPRYVFESDASVGPITFRKVKLTSAPLVAYQVPYYLARGNGHVMRYDTTLVPGVYYLAHRSAFPAGAGPALYAFPDLWMEDELVLFRAR
jgi:hypothetical protein